MDGVMGDGAFYVNRMEEKTTMLQPVIRQTHGR